MRCSLLSDPWNIEARQEGIAVSPNTTYNYLVWGKGTERASVDFSVGRPDYSEFTGARTNVELNGNWQEVTLQFTTGADDATVRTPIRFSRAGNVGAPST